jgi:adenylate kinase family enzyme
MKKSVRVFKNVNDITFNENDKNIIFITGLSGSGKSYLSKELANKYNSSIFQPEWLIHYTHTSEEFKPFLDEFIDRYNIRNYVDSKWDNSKDEDNNEELKKYINLLVKEFILNANNSKKYIVEGLQLFTLIDINLIKNYYLIVKGTSSVNSLKNRLKRDYTKRKDYKFIDKIKWFIKVIRQSKLYQFKHRKRLNEFIKKMEG